MRIFFTIDGAPVAKGRPRFARMGRGIRTYTPPRTEAYEALVRTAARSAMGTMHPLGGPLHVSVEAVMPIPVSWSKKKREAAADGGGVPHVKRPDVDNIAKAVLDGLNGIAFEDDAQIINLKAFKRYGEVPRVHVMIEEVE